MIPDRIVPSGGAGENEKVGRLATRERPGKARAGLGQPAGHAARKPRARLAPEDRAERSGRESAEEAPAGEVHG